MRCNQKQFDAIFPKLHGRVEELPSLRINEEEKMYLVNNLYGNPGRIASIKSNTSKEFGRAVHETWNEEIFLDACNISTISYKEVLLEVPKSDIILINDLGKTDNICLVFKGGVKSPVIYDESNGFVSILDSLADNFTIDKSSVSSNVQKLINAYYTMGVIDKILLFPDKKSLYKFLTEY